MKIINMRKGSWGKLTAFFDVVTDEGFIMKGFKLVNGINGPFVGFPSQKGNDDEYYDTIWITEESRESMREKLNQMASGHYNNMEGNTSPPTPIIESENAPLETSKDDTKTKETLEAPFSEDDLPF